MSSPRETHISDLLPAYALNSLDTDEARQVANHLLTCDECYREFLAYQAVVDRLPYAAPGMRPSPTIKGRLMSRIRTQHSPHTLAEPVIPWWQRRLHLRLNTGWAVALSVIVILFISNIFLYQKLNEVADAGLAVSPVPTLNEPGLRAIPLKSTRAAPGAKGMLIISADGKRGILVVDGLPGIANQQVFQAWLGESQQPNSAGILNVNDNGYGWIEINAVDRPLHEYPYFGVTVEPAGGSPLPTGDSVLAVYR